MDKASLTAMNKEYGQHYAVRSRYEPFFSKQTVHNQELDAYPAEFKRLYVRSQMGTGKTKRLLEYMRSLINREPQARICIFSFRVTFGLDLLGKINKYMETEGLDARFVCYKNIKERVIRTQYLII